MTETDVKKIPFFKLLNLEAVTPENDSSTIFKNHLLVLPRHNGDLVYKNNSIKTGYENFCIKKGTLKLYPFKDFDFIGKHVVCQKCCQKFASKLSYKAHVGTGICVRTYNGPNLIYLKYKNRNYRQVRKKNKKKSEEDFHGHDIKKNLLNPEMLNTLQTRNKVYSDNIIHQRNKVKEKPTNNSDKNNDEPSVKKPRGRPKKNIISNNVEVNLRKRGRPKKINVVTVDSSSQNDDSSSQNDNNSSQNDNNSSQNDNNSSQNDDDSSQNDDDSSSNLTFQERMRRKFFYRNLDDEYNKDIDDIFNSNALSMNFGIKYLTVKFHKFFRRELKSNGPVCIYDYQFLTKNQTQYNEENKNDLSAEEKAIFLKIDDLDYDLEVLYKYFQSQKECVEGHNPIESMLTISNLIKQRKLKETDMKGSIPEEGKENIQRTLKMNGYETEIEMNNTDFDKNEKCLGIWIKNSNTGFPASTIKMNDGCKSINRTNVDHFKKESTSQDSFEDNLKTLTVDKTPNITNSVKNNFNDLGLNYVYNPILNCRKCRKKFTSIAEWKLHRSEHLVKLNKIFLCKVCGLKFKMYKNFTKHVNVHKRTEQKKSYDKKSLKNLICKICNRQYDYLRSYYAHIKTHVDE